MLVCVDAMVLIWGVRGEAEKSHADKVPLVKMLLQKLESEGHHIVVPAPAAHEFLVGVPPERIPETARELGRRFVILPFDAAAASEAARVWLEKNNGRALAEDLRLGRKCATKAAIRADCQIVGIALSRKIKVIYTTDDDIQRLASEYLQVRNISLEHVQMPLID